MSREKLFKMTNFETIIDRLKAAVHLKHNKELAATLGIPYNTFNTMKRRNSIPYDRIISFCATHGINLEQMFKETGEGEMTATTQPGQPAAKSQTERQSASLKSSTGDLVKMAEQILQSENTEAAAALARSISELHQEVSTDTRLTEPDEIQLVEIYRRLKRLDAKTARVFIKMMQFNVDKRDVNSEPEVAGDVA